MLTSIAASRMLQHEIRTPLTIILGMISHLKKTCLTPMQANYVNAILVSANDLLKISNQLKPQMPSHKPITLKKPKVLLIEDDPMIQCIHQYMLSDLGCETDGVRNAAQALVVANQDYDMIMLDIGLPDLNGIEVAKRLRAHQNHINTPIIILTAYTDPWTEKDCLEAGVTCVLHKPIELTTLAEVLRANHLIGEK